jgi:hypothetical protein
MRIFVHRTSNVKRWLAAAARGAVEAEKLPKFEKVRARG